MKKILFIMVALGVTFSCKTNTDPSSDDSKKTTLAFEKEKRNKQIVLKRLKAMDTGRADSVIRDESTDKDFIDYRSGGEEPVKGIEAARSALQHWMNAFPDYKGNNFLVIAEGDFVMVYAEWTGTWKNDFKGMKATGKSFRIYDVDIFRLTDEGKVIEHRDIQSIPIIAKQVDMPIPNVL
jgi:predicted ester cyclase